LKKYFDIGINRLSIGLQTTHDDLLKKIGRIHTFEQFLSTYDMARNIGFKNINVDLMLGLPGQSIDMLNESVKKIVELRLEHISIYSLILEEDTVLYNKVMNKEIEVCDDELERKMYWEVKRFFEHNGYKHYEISNFALDGFESVHNTDCWRQKEYIGIGAGASSFFEDKRYTNSYLIEEYISDNEVILEEVLDKNSKMKEFVMLGLRKIEGISLQEFLDRFKIDFFDIFKEEFDKLFGIGLIVCENNYIKLTDKGSDLANLVWEEFV